MREVEWGKTYCR